ncbi:MAG: hypothetical protein ACJA2W_003340 [Planctomycetota bacterium]|jgi:hypothetical protein
MLKPCFATVVVLVSTSTLARSQTPNYQIVALPDTQVYTTTPELVEIMLEQIDWIRAHAETDEITFVAHVGDVVESGATGPNRNEVGWERAVEALDRLEGGPPESQRSPMPYSVAIGNRDYDVISDKDQGTSRFEEFFSRDRYVDEPWYLGS